MRLEADEEAMYKRMDRRDLYRWFSAIFAVMGTIFLILIAAGYRSWQMIYLEIISMVGIIVMFACYWNKDQDVMDLSGCFLELQEGILTICQPLKAQAYENARISVTEVKGLAAESRNGYPRFYVMLKEDSRDSQIMADGNVYRAMRVESFGYIGGEFWELFLKFREEVSQCQAVSSLKIPENKKWRKSRQFPYPVLYLFLYIVPVIVLLLS